MTRSPAPVPEPAPAPAWIRTIPPAEADGRLRELYEPFTEPDTQQTDHILMAHSLHVEGLEGHLAIYTAAMTGTATLPRSEREMIGVVVSGINGCHY